MHGDTFLTLLIINAQIATELQWAILYSGHCNCLRSCDWHPVRKPGYSAIVKKFELQVLVITKRPTL